MRAPDELRALVEQGLADLTPTASLDGLSEAMRYALDGGGKRIRPVLCLATAEAAGGRAEDALPAAVGLELVHTFSLVHDDLPSLDDDDERRGRPSVARRLRRGRCAARRRRIAHGGVAPRALLRPPPAGPRARRGDARHDRRAVPRRHGRAGRPRRVAPAEDRSPLRGGGRARALGGGGARAATRTPWRAFGDELGVALPGVDDMIDGGRLRARARRGRRARSRRGRRAPRARAPRRDRRRHVGAGRARRRARGSDGVAVAKKRLDVVLVERGLAESRAQAQALVMAGLVPGYDKPGQQVDEDVELERASARRGSSRAAGRSSRTRSTRSASTRREGLPRPRRLDRWVHRLPPAARRGAGDRARRRLRPAPSAAARRRPRDRARARQRAAPGRAAVSARAVTCDVSFISATRVLPPALALAAPGWEALVLVKPQFEAGRADVAEGRRPRPGSAPPRPARRSAPRRCAGVPASPES